MLHDKLPSFQTYKSATHISKNRITHNKVGISLIYSSPQLRENYSTLQRLMTSKNSVLTSVSYLLTDVIDIEIIVRFFCSFIIYEKLLRGILVRDCNNYMKVAKQDDHLKYNFKKLNRNP